MMRKCATPALAAVAIFSVALPSAAIAQSVESRQRDPLAPLEAGVGGPLEPVDPLAPEAAPDASAEAAAPEVTHIIRWINSTRDNGDRPFMVIDKVGAKAFLFDAGGQFMGETAALLGSTAGDESSPGVGDRELSQIKPEERTTPAGRFVANFGIARGNEKVLWVDYATSISLHPVVTRNRKEQRLKRLKSPTAEDNRITFGCINVPRAFYTKTVLPLFGDAGGIVYILPETKPLNEVFLAYRG
jgi:hypothetical protein